MIALLFYALGAILAFTFQLLLVATAVTLYLGAWIVFGLVYFGARILGAAWRPRRPSYRRRPLPQAAYSDRR